MRNLLALIGLVVVGFGGAGWYLGWYKLSVTRSDDGNLQIKADVDTKKVGTDASTGFKNLSNAVEKQTEKATPPTGTPVSTPGPVTPPHGSTFNPLSPHLPEAPKLPSGTIQLIPPK